MFPARKDIKNKKTRKGTQTSMIYNTDPKSGREKFTDYKFCKPRQYKNNTVINTLECLFLLSYWELKDTVQS